MQEYHDLLNLVLEKGKRKKNRTGIDTIGVFGAQQRFDLSKGFPLLSTKKMFWKGIVHELLWFLSGSTNIKYLVDNDVHIWDEWAFKKALKNGLTTSHGDPTLEEFVQVLKACPASEDLVKINGDLGEGTYGGMWRAFPFREYQDSFYRNYPKAFDTEDGNDGFVDNIRYYSYEDNVDGNVDQISKVVDKLKSNPDDRRLIVSAWHPYWVDHCALPPCHVLFHFNTEELTWKERIQIMKDEHRGILGIYDNEWRGEEAEHKKLDAYNVPKRRLNCLLYQRSCDLFLGVPFNIASYSLLTQMVAHCVNMVPGEFIHTYGDLHIYENHLDQVKEQLSREPKKLPTISLNQNIKSIFNFKYEDITLENYKSWPAIRAEVAV